MMLQHFNADFDISRFGNLSFLDLKFISQHFIDSSIGIWNPISAMVVNLSAKC